MILMPEDLKILGRLKSIKTTPLHFVEIQTVKFVENSF